MVNQFLPVRIPVAAYPFEHSAALQWQQKGKNKR
jgi:hypothetical protein